MSMKMLKVSWCKRFQARLMQFYFINIAAILMSACASGLPDGSICRKDEDCRSTHCRTNLCSGSECKFSKSDKQGDCEDGWECTLFHGSGIIFSSSGGYFCALPCPTCPERYQCLFQDEYCSPKPGWANPTVTVTPNPARVMTGEPVTLHANAVSPIGEDIEFTYKWPHLNPPATGPDVTLSFDTPGTRTSVVDADSVEPKLQGFGFFSIEVCSPAGVACSNNTLCCSQNCSMQGMCM